MQKQSHIILAMHALTCTGLSFVVIGITNAHAVSIPAKTTAAATAGSDTVVHERVISEESDLVQMVKRAEPAVVSVVISKNVPKLEQQYENIPFHNFSIRVPRYVQNGTQTEQVGGGTAFFVSDTGLLMTNNHVVADTTADYTVLLNDGRQMKARILRRDATADIALLQVDGHGLPYLSLSRSDTLNLAQTAVAIGNSLGEFRNTVSVGIVSGLSRSITASTVNGGSEQLDQVIQTDAAINEGNSGGPLLDSSGNVIGMNTAIASGAQNIGFAIQASQLRKVLSEYLASLPS